MWSRRGFVLAAAGTVLGARPALASTQALTAQQAFDRIRAALGVPWRDGTNDGLKAGDPALIVTGVTTTAMATFDVLRRSAAAGRNLIVTHEPTFYSANDAAGNRADDAVYLAKKAFIDEKLAVIRLADHWNARGPSEPVRALAAALDWARYRRSEQDPVYTLPATTLSAVRAHVEKRLDATGIRVVGRPDLRVSNVVVSPGTTDLATVVKHLPSADLVLAGEPREWEVVPYVLDAIEAGQRKGLIALGRIVSEGPSARACGDWLRTILPGLPIETLAVADPLRKVAR